MDRDPELPFDSRRVVGWRGLAALVLDAVSSLPNRPALAPPQTTLLLTLTTYSYAANILSSEEIERATADEAEMAYLTLGVTVTASGIRNFRRRNRAEIESCLAHVYFSMERAKESLGNGGRGLHARQLATEFARKRLQLAILFDTSSAD